MDKSYYVRLVALILAIIAVFNLSAYIGLKLILANSFENLERESVLENVQRAVNAYENDLEALGTLCGDWAHWDDSYSFIQDADPSYIQSNLVDSTFSDLQLNAIIFIDSQGKLVFGRAMDFNKELEASLPSGLTNRVLSRPELWQMGANVEFDGLFMLSEGPILVSIRSILQSDGEGPSRGSVVMARWLDSDVLARIAGRTKLSLHIKQLFNSRRLNPEKTPERPEVEIHPDAPGIIWGHFPLKDVTGASVLRLSVKMDRDIYLQGRETINSVFKGLLLISLLVGFVAYLLITRYRGKYDVSEKKFQYLFENVNDGLLVVDSGGRIKTINRAARELLEIKHDIERCSDIEGLSKEDGFCDLIDQCLAGEEVTPHVFTLSDPRQNIRKYLHAHATQMTDGQGQPLGAIVAIHDVTGQTEADLLKSEFIAVAAHELNTPISTVMGFSELLLSLDGISEDERRDYLTIIFEKSEALGKIVDDLLHLSKFESGGRIHLEKRDYNLESSVEQLLTSYRQKSERHRFEIDLPKHQVHADPHRIDQVLDNLLSNAVKYSPEGGTIRVHGQSSGDALIVCVEDEGVGMNTQQLERAFEKFYRAEDRPQSSRGLGLGLSITRNLVEEHEGEIWIESSKGAGTKVYFTVGKGQE